MRRSHSIMLADLPAQSRQSEVHAGVAAAAWVRPISDREGRLSRLLEALRDIEC